MHFKSNGNGPVILLIHGFCEDLTIWEDLTEVLCGSHKVIAIDLPGFGKSPPPNSSASIKDIALEVVGFLENQKIKKCSVIGHSLGGYVALALADISPKLLSGIGLFHSTIFPDSEEKKLIREKAISHVEKHGIESFSEGFVPNLFCSKNHSKFKREIELLKRMANNTNQNIFITYSRAMKERPDFTALWSDWRGPAFVIAGDSDVVIPLAQSKKMISMILNGDSVILHQTGHMGFIESQIESFEFINNFLLRFKI